MGDGVSPLLSLASACELPFHSLFSLCHSCLGSCAGEGVQLGLGLQSGLLPHDGEGELHEGEEEDPGDGGEDHADGDGDQEGEELLCLSLLLLSLLLLPSPLSSSRPSSSSSWRLCQQPGHRRRMPT